MTVRRHESRVARYGVALLLTGGCAAAWALLAPQVEFEATLLLFVLPVFVSTWYGGVGPGALSAALSLTSAALLMPAETSASGLRGDRLDLLLFATEATLIVVLTGALQRARNAAERASRAKDRLVAIVSHELRNPLNVISGSVTQLRHRHEDVDRIDRGLRRIERAARIQSRIIEDLLDVSRAASGKLAIDRQTISLTPVLQSAVDDVRSLADAKHVQLGAEINTAAVVDADPVRLGQVFSNLLGNAVKFTPEGGRVDVNADVRGDYVRVSVNDTGPGIPSSALPFLFEPFRQVDVSRDTRAGGLGLGLAVAKQVVELHGGRISVKSRGRNKGTSFVVDLHVAPPAHALNGPPVAAHQH
jgi:signal transduction histidine kinase